MSCYLRHLTKPLEQAGIILNKENRKQADQLVRAWAGQEGVQCNHAWRQVKVKISADGEDSLITYLKAHW